MKKSLSKSELLRKKKEIKSLFLTSRQSSCKGMKLLIAENTVAETRVLVTLVRGFGTAVERNYTRRIVKELFRQFKHSLPTGIDYGFLMYPGAFTFRDREQQMLGLLQRARILPSQTDNRSFHG